MSTRTQEKFGFHDLQRIMSKLIDRVETFNGLTQQELLALLEGAEKCTFDSGTAIVRQGSTGAFLYIIIDGRVSVRRAADAPAIEAPPATELATLEAGDSFGEMSLVDRQIRSASIVAVTPCVLLRLTETACWAQPMISAKIFRNIARIVSRRLRDMNEAYVLSCLPG